MIEVEEQQDINLDVPVLPDDDLLETAPSRAIGLGRTVTDYIVEHPEICLGIALAVGAAVGLVVKRR